MTNIFYHLGFEEGLLNSLGCRVCILSGDPERTEFLAKKVLKKSELLSAKRGLVSYLGYLPNDQPVLFATSGMGAPSTSIVINELAQAGIKTIVRLGTTGAIQDNIPVGSLILSKSSLCRQGAANDVAPVEYPASADPFLTVKLFDNLTKRGLSVFCGITASVDTFYEGQERYHGTNSILMRKHIGMVEEYKNLKVLNFEMESGTLFKCANVYGLSAACICVVVTNRTFSEFILAENIEKFLLETTRAILTTFEDGPYER